MVRRKRKNKMEEPTIQELESCFDPEFNEHIHLILEGLCEDEKKIEDAYYFILTTALELVPR